MIFLVHVIDSLDQLVHTCWKFKHKYPRRGVWQQLLDVTDIIWVRISGFLDFVHCPIYNLADSKGLWWPCITLGITGFWPLSIIWYSKKLENMKTSLINKKWFTFMSSPCFIFDRTQSYYAPASDAKKFNSLVVRSVGLWWW
jgi:hypothetical protein